jgi:polar amino acid transport system ATP-binding protein
MIVNIQNVSKFYDKQVLNNISFELRDKKSLAIIGASGSGKSTLLRLLSGMETAEAGLIEVNGMNVLSEEYKMKIGFVFQTHNLFPHLSLEKNISLILEKTRGYSIEEATEVARKNLSLLHLEDQFYKLPKNVSGGQAQRASIARALSINPEIMFLDEPTSSLDPILTYEVLEAIKELRGYGKDFVLVTHEMGFVRDFADYIIFMDQGEIIEHGDLSLLDNPKSEVMKDFMKKVK